MSLSTRKKRSKEPARTSDAEHATASRGGKSSRTPFTTVTIPIELANKIKNRIKGSGFTSLSSYVTFVLREILGQQDHESKEAEASPISEKEKNALLTRLRNLGYID